VDSGIGVFDDSANNRIERNSVSGNAEVINIALGSRHNLVNGSEAGLEITADPETPDDASARNVVSKNTVTGSRGDGILVSADQRRTVIDGNRVSASTDDGINVESAATTLRNDTANRNHDLGIEAAPGVTDGGGNTARGNGNPLQCINVACTPRVGHKSRSTSG
jgi:parallel beta-helix repeat protein